MERIPNRNTMSNKLQGLESKIEHEADPASLGTLLHKTNQKKPKDYQSGSQHAINKPESTSKPQEKEELKTANTPTNTPFAQDVLVFTTTMQTSVEDFECIFNQCGHFFHQAKFEALHKYFDIDKNAASQEIAKHCDDLQTKTVSFTDLSEQTHPYINETIAWYNCDAVLSTSTHQDSSIAKRWQHLLQSWSTANIANKEQLDKVQTKFKVDDRFRSFDLPHVAHQEWSSSMNAKFCISAMSSKQLNVSALCNSSVLVLGIQKPAECEIIQLPKYDVNSETSNKGPIAHPIGYGGKKPGVSLIMKKQRFDSKNVRMVGPLLLSDSNTKPAQDIDDYYLAIILSKNGEFEIFAHMQPIDSNSLLNNTEVIISRKNQIHFDTLKFLSGEKPCIFSYNTESALVALGVQPRNVERCYITSYEFHPTDLKLTPIIETIGQIFKPQTTKVLKSGIYQTVVHERIGIVAYTYPSFTYDVGTPELLGSIALILTMWVVCCLCQKRTL